MIWFGNLARFVQAPPPRALARVPLLRRMQNALERVAEHAPGLEGPALLDALEGTGWIDRSTAERLLPHFQHFDPDRHFAEHLRRLSFRGRARGAEFREGVRCVLEEIVGVGSLGALGPEPCIRTATPALEGIVLAYPEVAFSVSGPLRDAVAAAVEEMPDALVVIARNFDPGAARQLAGMLARSGVPGTLVTVNLLLGIRATALRYRSPSERVLNLLGTGRPLRSADIATLSERPVGGTPSQAQRLSVLR